MNFDSIPETNGYIIWTHLIGLPDTKESQITAVCAAGDLITYRKTVAYDPSVNCEANHTAAAEALMAFMETDPAYEGCKPFRIVGRGRFDHGYYFRINR